MGKAIERKMKRERFHIIGALGMSERKRQREREEGEGWSKMTTEVKAERAREREREFTLESCLKLTARVQITENVCTLLSC